MLILIAYMPHKSIITVTIWSQIITIITYTNTSPTTAATITIVIMPFSWNFIGTQKTKGVLHPLNHDSRKIYRNTWLSPCGPSNCINIVRGVLQVHWTIQILLSNAVSTLWSQNIVQLLLFCEGVGVQNHIAKLCILNTGVITLYYANLMCFLSYINI